MIKKIGSIFQCVGLASLGVASFLLFGTIGAFIYAGVALFAVGVMLEIGKV